MSATETQPDSSYFLRKLHSFTGLLPVGAFLAEHFWSNSAALVSANKYDEVSQELQTIPFRLIVEGVLASSFHLGVGVWNFLCKWGLAATARAQQAAGRLGALVGITFSVVGILIILSFRLNWHPFAFYITK